MKATEQYFHVVLFIMLYKVVLTLKPVDETPVCNHSNESYGTEYYPAQSGFKTLIISPRMKNLPSSSIEMSVKFSHQQP